MLYYCWVEGVAERVGLVWGELIVGQLVDEGEVDLDSWGVVEEDPVRLYKNKAIKT